MIIKFRLKAIFKILFSLLSVNQPQRFIYQSIDENDKGGIMERKNVIQKVLTIAVIILFIGISVAPSINANLSKEKDLVEFTIELCGLKTGKEKVKLTRGEAEKVESLFDSIGQRMKNIETSEESEKIFKEAVLELDRFGLLGSLSVKQAQRLIFSVHKTPIIRVLEKTHNKNSISLDENENLFCLMTGKTTYTTCFQKPVSTFFIQFAMISYSLELEKLGSWFLLFWILSSIFVYNNPIAVLLKIGLGIYEYGDSNRIPARGWIVTLGMNGKKNWNNTFYGQLPHLFGIPLLMQYGGVSYSAIIGYTGIKLQSSDGLGFYYLGSALYVKIGSEPPY